MSTTGVSSKDLAASCSMKPPQVSDYLRGKSSPGIEVLERFAKALNVSPAYLLMTPEERSTWDQAKAQAAPKVEQLRAEMIEVVQTLSELELGLILRTVREVRKKEASQKKSG